MKSLNQNAKVLNIVTDEIDGNFDLIFADAVLLHLTRDELYISIAKIYNALNSDGRFSFSLKTGTGEEWSNSKINAPRYFCYWQPQEIEEILIGNGFKNPQVKNTDDKWFNIIASK